MTGSPNPAALAAGLLLVGLGILLGLDRQGGVDLGFAYTAPLLVATLGAVLLAGGLGRRGSRRG